jgi:hypothetical protein
MVGTHRRRTLRGQFTEGETKRLIVDDGRLNHGYKVVRFVIAGDPSSSGNDAFATLSLDYDAPATWNWGDNRQIGWASTNVQGTAGLEPSFSVIDPDHVVIMDLYITGQVSGAGGTSLINYLIELQTVELSDDQAILTLIKERSQDDLR